MHNITYANMCNHVKKYIHKYSNNIYMHSGTTHFVIQKWRPTQYIELKYHGTLKTDIKVKNYLKNLTQYNIK